MTELWLLRPVVAGVSGGGGGGGGTPGPPRGNTVAAGRLWLAAVFAAYVVLLGGLLSRCSWRAHSWCDPALGVAAAALQAALLVLLSRRVVLPSTTLADWGFAPPVPPVTGGEADRRRALVFATATRGPALGWPATARWLAWVVADTAAYVLATFSAAVVVLLAALGVLLCMPAATPPLVVGLVTAALVGGGGCLLATVVKEKIAARERRDGRWSRVSGGGERRTGADSPPPGTQLLLLPQIGAADAEGAGA